MPEVLQQSHHVGKHAGGNGADWEAYDFILKASTAQPL